VKRLITISIALFAAFYAHSKIVFSESNVMSMLTRHNTKALSGDSAACDDYANDVAVELTAEDHRGRWEVEGGKDELCGYLKQASAALTVLQASTSSEFTDVSISRSGFPWTTATVKYTERTVVSAAHVPEFTSVSHDEMKLARSFTGLKIIAVRSTSRSGA
jgi:hypothetical protein